MTSIEERIKLVQAKANAMIKPGGGDENKESSSTNQMEGCHSTYKVKENIDIKPSSFKLRPLYSKVDINCDKFLLTMDEVSRAKLEAPPSLAEGLEASVEADLRFLGCELIQQGSILLRLPQTAAATGQILFQRFYYQRSFVTFMFEHTVMACLMLASKIEEAPRRPRDVYNVFRRLDEIYEHRLKGHKVTSTSKLPFKAKPLDEAYSRAKNNMIKAERRLMATLGFVVHVKHPHKLICSYAFLVLKEPEYADQRNAIVRKAWGYMNDGLRTDMFLRYSAETIACACIYLAARTIKNPISLPSTPFHWFELFGASDRDVNAIALMLQGLYSRPKPVNMVKLVKILDEIRDRKEKAEKMKHAQEVAQRLGEQSSKAKEKVDQSTEENKRSKTHSRSRSPSRTKDKRESRNKHDSPERRRRNGGARKEDRDRRDRDRERERGDRRDDKRRSRSRERKRDRSRDRDNKADKYSSRDKAREKEREVQALKDRRDANDRKRK